MLSNKAVVSKRRSDPMCVLWKGATAFGNYFRDDPVLDVFDRIRPNTLNDLLWFYGRRKSQTLRGFRPRVVTPDPVFVHIASKGREYEASVLAHLKSAVPNYLDIGATSAKDALSMKLFVRTKKALLHNTYDMVVSGVVRHYATQTFGIPDLIMRGNIITSMFGIEADAQRYYAVDIKASDIPVNEHMDVLSNISVVGYKSQLLVYELALQEMLKYKDQGMKAYILGKQYSHPVRGKLDGIRSLGVVNYEGREEHMVAKLYDAIRWLNRVDLELDTFRFNPPNCDELYPNMKNPFNKHYEPVKLEYANFIDEITRMFHCGVAHRRHAFSLGIRRLCDVETAADLGFAAHSTTGRLVSKILRARSPVIIPPTNNVFGWRFPRAHEWFIDIEMANQYIYMVGVLNEAGYFGLVAPTLDAAGEAQVLSQLVAMHPKQMVYAVHWGGIEKREISERLRRHGIKGSEEFLQMVEWCDLHSVFKYMEAPIIVQDAVGYGLKKVATALAKNGWLRMRFDTDIRNGLQSLIRAEEMYKRQPLDVGELNELVLYNKADCQTLDDLLRMMRLVS